MATFSADLSRRGPGLLLRDILRGENAQVDAVVGVIAEVHPDILLLTDFDHDLGNAALSALAERLDAAGLRYPYLFSLRSNAGLASGLDLDGNGRTGEPRDAQGYGRFAGDGAMALLSRWPIDEEDVQDFSSLLWKDLPGARLPRANGRPFPSEPAQNVQRLSSTGHWDVPVELPDGTRLHLLAFAATPPVFDGPEDRNGLRNADEIALWQRYLDGALGVAPPADFLILGNANLDPDDGGGLPDAIRGLLADPRLQDPLPRSSGGAAAATVGQTGDPALDTADWPEPDDDGPGNLRVDYVLPARSLMVRGSGVHWPEGPAGAEAAAASPHRLVWVDVEPTP
ncbi:endonuclease/exonuclease/phosphatase family protein [Tropicimonas isoalkanivorans]|uniref:Endonuclease/Exonuclease/phosphatase family protein n=1 Tax=Tropicimonas isoalkanivorans TaxID=441112 RepID=A0A1I1MI13_9RHOB|nr:endonuclease/exonuclease/phosphatase family protein [Tropicimonas isoalkanivorans]SFC85047.1 Endonuclease/Exonuclease/phosphatase family protein [Tropicimonas isoalkanivorans]